MDYLKHYENLINKAKERSWNKNTSPCYVEKHHIVPKSIGGHNEKWNLVYLTAKEHFIAHLLLHREFPQDYNLFFGFYMMVSCRNSNHQKFFINSKYFEELRIKNSKFLKSRKMKEESKIKLSKNKKRSISLYDINGNILKSFNSHSELQNFLGVARPTLTNYIKVGYFSNPRLLENFEFQEINQIMNGYIDTRKTDINGIKKVASILGFHVRILVNS